MRVSEAKEQIMSELANGKTLDAIAQRVEAILDEVWLEAYEEGKAKTFEPPTSHPGRGI